MVFGFSGLAFRVINSSRSDPESYEGERDAGREKLYFPRSTRLQTAANRSPYTRDSLKPRARVGLPGMQVSLIRRQASFWFCKDHSITLHKARGRGLVSFYT